MSLDAQVTAVSEMVWDLQQAVERTLENLDNGEIEEAQVELRVVQQSLDITNMPALRQCTVSRRRVPGT
ncbi:MAG: hypothetical protein K940chlam2_00047 [Chlamydiae bacterium]|nr:hypothetical protein [Chlamydiota bacterium]